MQRAITIILASLCLLAIIEPATADDDNILAQLGHEQFTVRRQATRNLLADPQLSDQTIDRLFARALLVEQQHRLLDVARHHMLKRIRVTQYPAGNRGSLGVSIKQIEAHQLPDQKHGAIYIDRTFPGFPAYWRLQRGDLIMAINDQRPEGLNKDEITKFLQARITRMMPGTPVRLTVLRNTKTINVTVNLASMQALIAMYPSVPVVSPRFALPLAADLQTAWQIRRQQLLDLLPKT